MVRRKQDKENNAVFIDQDVAFRDHDELENSSNVSQPVVEAPIVIDLSDVDFPVSETDPSASSRETLTLSPVLESSAPIAEATENVVSPVIGSSPSTFFRTPWSRTEKPLHGLSMNGYAGDIHCDAGTFGKVASIGATMRGLKHQVPDRTSGAAGQNEDWFSIVCAVSAGGKKYVVSVVCDGLSSAPYSWYGARRTSTLLGRDVAAGIAQLEDVNSRTLQSVVDKSLEEQASTLMTWNVFEYGAPQVAPADVDPVDL